jgi:hypothetical protein
LRLPREPEDENGRVISPSRRMRQNAVFVQ